MKRREFLKVAAGLLLARPRMDRGGPAEDAEALRRPFPGVHSLQNPPSEAHWVSGAPAGPLQAFQDLMNATPAVYVDAIGEFQVFETTIDAATLRDLLDQ